MPNEDKNPEKPDLNKMAKAKVLKRLPHVQDNADDDEKKHPNPDMSLIRTDSADEDYTNYLEEEKEEKEEEKNPTFTRRR